MILDFIEPKIVLLQWAHNFLSYMSNTPILWDKFDPLLYVKDNYVELHDEDRIILYLLSATYHQLPRLSRAVEIGVGPNLYPLMAMLPVVKKIDAIDYNPANLHYLKRQLKKPDGFWLKYWRLLQQSNSIYQINLLAELRKKVTLPLGDIYALPENTYDLASMNFCAESITTNKNMFKLACRKYIRAVKSGGYYIASFMENSSGYSVGAYRFPSYPIDKTAVINIFKPVCDQWQLYHIPKAHHPLRSGYSGMLLFIGRKK